MEISNAVLYYKPTCPYCVKVLDFMEVQGLECALADTTNPEVREELVSIGGKPQVPCLVIDGAPLYESDDIIAWMQNLA